MLFDSVLKLLLLL